MQLFYMQHQYHRIEPLELARKAITTNQKKTQVKCLVQIQLRRLSSDVMGGVPHMSKSIGYIYLPNTTFYQVRCDMKPATAQPLHLKRPKQSNSLNPKRKRESRPSKAPS